MNSIKTETKDVARNKIFEKNIGNSLEMEMCGENETNVFVK